jgi:SAM-dependent methyltransferase
VAHDPNVTPWPFEDSSAEEIVAVDVVEHLDSFIAFFDECHRILAGGGKVTVRVPRWDSINVAIDPTHKRGYHPESFDYLDPETRWGSQYGTSYTSRGWRKISVMMNSENIMATMEVRK